MPPAGKPDAHYMRIALSEALQTPTLPYPNPWVGCVIVRGNVMVGRGCHRGPGTLHAEAAALAQAGARARGATLYVTLEPCRHFGRTPPCTDAILKAGVRRVVYSIRDPNPEVSGRGAAILRKAGVEISHGVLAKEGAALNEVYLKFRSAGLPFVTAKIAASLDGKIATRTGESQWITDAKARRRARELRSRHQAVLVGVNTVLADDPHLGPRLRGAENPWRVVMDSRLRTPPGSQVVRSGRCILAAGRFAGANRRRALEKAGAIVWQFPGARPTPEALLKKLASTGILSVMVEGGAEIFGAFFDRGLIDRLFWFYAPLVIGSEKSKAAVAGRGVARLAQARVFSAPLAEKIGRCWMLRVNASRWALA